MWTEPLINTRRVHVLLYIHTLYIVEVELLSVNTKWSNAELHVIIGGSVSDYFQLVILLQRKKRSEDSIPTPSTSDEPGVGQRTSQPKKHRGSTVKVREAPNRSTMTMQELIYYNPSANPMR